MNENCNSEQAKQSETQSLLFSTFFLSQAKNSKTQQPSVAKEGYITTAEEEPQNTQQRNHKSAHFYFACIVTSLGLNDETCTVKWFDDSEQQY